MPASPTWRQLRQTLADELGALSANPMAEAERWILRASGWNRARLFTRLDEPATATIDAKEWADRLSGTPLAYVWGSEEFFGLELRVNPAVLIPRPDTETLIDRALAFLHWREWPRAPRVLDLGTGSGAIALAIKQEMPACEVTATDRSPAALKVAQENAETCELPVNFVQSCWWDELAPGDSWDLIVSNPPYIDAADTHLADLSHEPIEALVAPAQGLADLRTIIEGAPAHLLPGGRLIVEHGHDQAAAVCEIYRACGYTDVTATRDHGDNERVTEGSLS